MMKTLITTGGRGTRVRSLTHTSNKHLIPIANKLMIHYAIDAPCRRPITILSTEVSLDEQRARYWGLWLHWEPLCTAPPHTDRLAGDQSRQAHLCRKPGQCAGHTSRDTLSLCERGYWRSNPGRRAVSARAPVGSDQLRRGVARGSEYSRSWS